MCVHMYSITAAGVGGVGVGGVGVGGVGVGGMGVGEVGVGGDDESRSRDRHGSRLLPLCLITLLPVQYSNE